MSDAKLWIVQCIDEAPDFGFTTRIRIVIAGTEQDAAKSTGGLKCHVLHVGFPDSKTLASHDPSRKGFAVIFDSTHARPTRLL